MFGGFQVGPFQPLPAYQQEVRARQTGAGRKRRRKKYVIEVDGREFLVEDAQEAQSLLDRAKSLAEKTALAKADEVVGKATPRALRVGKARPVILKPPTITGPDWPEVRKARDEIRRIYLEAAVIAELRLLLILRQQDDDEETILLMFE